MSDSTSPTSPPTVPVPRFLFSSKPLTYHARPEAIESIFYLHRLTGNFIWRSHGWDMFLAVERLSRTEVAYSSVLDVTAPKTPFHQGVMESFWTAETLKYFWLLFESEDVLDLGEWVFNTEAHAFRLPK